MNDEQINIAIADASGLPWVDYCNDLNAMHEAEGTLKIMKKIEMERLLEREIIGSDYLIWRATARQRAEAFLRTLGKWKETK